MIKTDHFSLKYLMEQKITTAFQGKWLSKLMGFDYEICYKKGKENVVADGLSRVTSAQLMALTLSEFSSIGTGPEVLGGGCGGSRHNERAAAGRNNSIFHLHSRPSLQKGKTGSWQHEGDILLTSFNCSMLLH